MSKSKIDLLADKNLVISLINSEIDPQTPPDSITAPELNSVLQSIVELIEEHIDSTFNVVDKIEITNVYQGTTTDTLDQILLGYEPVINPKNTAFNKDFGVGGSSTNIPRYDDPRFSDERIPRNNSVSVLKLQDNVVNNNKLTDMAGLTLKGNNNAATSSPIDLTVPQVQTLLNVEDGAQVNLLGKNSIEINTNEYQLVGDISSPGNNFFYGTDAMGVKSFYDLEGYILSIVQFPNGDGWGTDVVQIISGTETTNNNIFNLLSGNGTAASPLLINGGQLTNFISEVINNTPTSDNWGSQVIFHTPGGGISGDGVTGDGLELNIRTDASLSGVGTASDNLKVDQNWLTTYISDYINNNGADNWGSQVAQTSGVITGNGLLSSSIRLINGSGSTNQLLMWDFTQGLYKFIDPSGLNNEFLDVNLISPLEGIGSISSPIKFIDGSNTDDILVWDGSSWILDNITTRITPLIPTLSDGKGWTGGTYNSGTGVITFTSTDGLGFSTGDIRGQQGIQGIQGVPGVQGAQGPTGQPFAIADVYTSVANLLADLPPTNVSTGQFAVVDTGNVNDVDTGKLYLYNGSSWSYITDMSGATGIQGPQGIQGIQGPPGTNGVDGIDGINGQGVPTGGNTNDVLIKVDGTDYNTTWGPAPSGGNGFSQRNNNLVKTGTLTVNHNLGLDLTFGAGDGPVVYKRIVTVEEIRFGNQRHLLGDGQYWIVSETANSLNVKLNLSGTGGVDIVVSVIKV